MYNTHPNFRPPLWDEDCSHYNGDITVVCWKAYYSSLTVCLCLWRVAVQSVDTCRHRCRLVITSALNAAHNWWVSSLLIVFCCQVYAHCEWNAIGIHLLWYSASSVACASLFQWLAWLSLPFQLIISSYYVVYQLFANMSSFFIELRNLVCGSQQLPPMT